MGNSLRSNGARDTGELSKSSTNDGANREENNGVVVKIDDHGISTNDSGGVSSNEISNKANTKGEKKKAARSSSKLVTGGKSPCKVVIENNTEKVLVLREKIRGANGIVRHSIDAKSSVVIQVSPQSTYYRLLVYVVEVKDQSTEDTGLTIDSDKLSDATNIVFSKDKNGKYIMS